MSDYNTMKSKSFNRRYDEIEKEIPYDPRWENGTGYLDFAVRNKSGETAPTKVDLKPGEEVKSVTPMPNNRKIIFIGTPLGPLVIFERFTNGQDAVYVTNKSDGLTALGIVPSSSLGYEDLGFVLGISKNSNIGTRITNAIEIGNT